FDEKEIYEPVMVVHKMGKVSDIAAVHCQNISIAIGEEGYVYIWGNCRGQKITIPTATTFSNMYDALACYGSPSVMHKPLILYSDEEPSVLECLGNSFDDEDTSDLTIQVEGQSIFVHKAILKIRCSYFRNMFQHDWAENNRSVIKLDQFSYVVYKTFLKYLYTGMINLPMEKTVELLNLADSYCESNLKKHCVRIIKQGISVSNVAYLYSVAVQYNEEELEEFCIRFAINHMTAVTQTESFANLDENTLRTFIIKTECERNLIILQKYLRLFYNSHEKKNATLIETSRSHICDNAIISVHNFTLNWPIFSLLEPEFVSQIHMVVVYGNLGNEALIMTKDKMMYALGNNIAGCLGIGDTHGTLYPKKVEALCERDIRTFAYGSGPHVLALTKEGEVYAWGHNGYGELGIGASNQVVTKPILVTMPILESLGMKRVVDIACGSHHSIALTEDGEVYAWGQNNCGQLGSSISTNQVTPRQVNSVLGGKKVVCISCGQTSTMVVIENGEVYGFGNNGVGQLGIGNYANQTSPWQVGSLRGIVIVKVVCGYAHTLALTDEGKLYVWGGNSYGQLGIGNKTNSCKPVMVEHEMGRVSDIAAMHYNHISVAVGEGGRVYMWGHCRGQSITIPTSTPFSNVHDALACYGSPSVMHKPLILYANEEPNILQCLGSAFDDPVCSFDLKIQVEGQCIHVHKAILKIRSSYFRTMFQHDWAENNQSVIEHDQFSYIVYKAFLKYLYTDVIDLPMEKALELLDLANAYCESNLKKHCIWMIKQGITVSNVAYLYSIAIEYNEEELEEVCFKFALNHMTAVTKTENFAKLDENTLKTFIIKAGEAGVFRT
ncbi:RCC1 and BTB domain-containing protein 1, partial [Trachymyrmex cornetzi]